MVPRDRMNQIIAVDRLMRPSLGRMAFIGELYDARSESLSSQSLFKQSLPPNCIRCTQMNQTDFDYKVTETISDRLALFKIEGELQLAVLSNLITLGGSAVYLTEETKSEKITSCSLIYKFLTVNEKLIASFEEILPHIDLTALNDTRFTHVVSEIEWGGNCLLSLQAACESESNKKNIQGHLGTSLSFLGDMLSAKPSGDLKKNSDLSLSEKKVTVKVSADILPKNGLPTSIEAFHQLVSDIPELLEDVNGGKGKPVSCFLIPLSGLRKLAELPSAVETVIQKIDDSFVSSLIFFFEDVTQLKRKFYDFVTQLQEEEKFVARSSLKEAREMQQQLAEKEAELKCLVRDEWVPLKSGKTTLRDLIWKVEQYKKRSFRLTSYEDFLDSQISTVTKLSTVRDYLSRGVAYLGRGERLDDLQRVNISKEFIVLVTSSEMEKADPDLHLKNVQYFNTLVSESFTDTFYVVLDLDFNQPNFGNVDRVTCFHLKGTAVLSKDLLADYLSECEINFARRQKHENLELCRHRPGNRVAVVIPCPGFEVGCCLPTAVEWQCSSCRTTLEFGFDDHFYCSCGKIPASSYEYRCKSLKHGNMFFTPTPKFLQRALSTLRPLKELNLLVLGQSGAGKSTWINSIINYLTYDSLEEARSSGALVVIPTCFTMSEGKNGKKRLIKMGEESADELTVAGHSATQISRTYAFRWGDWCIRIIDTPGLGDTEGIAKDKQNMQNVVSHISKLKELHAVCILMRASENRLHVLFSYCIKELLVHLHKSVAKNVVFCFTYSRTTIYLPGEASTLVESLIEASGLEDKLSLGQHNMFCLDNEAFRFLCALENGMTFDEDLTESFRKSWQVSLKETRRLFETVASFEPHALKQTVSLVTARMRVLSLTKPLAEVSKTIQMNIDTCNRKKVEFTDKNASVAELSKKLNLTVMELIPVPLRKPRTVCTSAKCVTYISLEGLDYKDVEYTTHCHKECYLDDVTPKTTNNVSLKRCKAMNSSGFCTVCGCSWASHMHIDFWQKREEKTIVNKQVEENLIKEKSEKESLQKFVESLQQKIDEYRREKEFIVRATAQFGLFLKKNAISVYNDHLEDYLLHLIKQEEQKPYKSEKEKKVLEDLRKTLEEYREEVQVLTTAIKEGLTKEELTPEGVCELEKKLYSLPLTGSMIKNLVDLSDSSRLRSAAYSERHVELRRPMARNPGNEQQKKTFWKRVRPW